MDAFELLAGEVRAKRAYMTRNHAYYTNEAVVARRWKISS